MAVRKTTLTIEDEVVARAREILGTKGTKDTVDAALHEVIAAQAEREYSVQMREMRGLDLDDPEVMRRAWPHDR